MALPVNPDKPHQLSREVLLFLVQLGAVISKSRAYPPGHPMLRSATEVLITQLFNLLKRRPTVILGVMHDRLIVDGVVTDPKHAVIRDLAGKIHRHQLASIELHPETDEAELSAFLEALGSESWRLGKPLGLESTQALAAKWPHIGIEPLPLGELELGEEAATDASYDERTEKIWQGLAKAALWASAESAEDGDGRAIGTPSSDQASGAEIARAIRSRRGDKSFSEEIVEWLLQIEDRLEAGNNNSVVYRRVADLFTALDPDTLASLMALGASVEQRREMVFKGARSLPIKAVLDLLQAASKASGQELSKSLLAILTKLASHLESGRGPIVPGAEAVFRDSVRHLLSGLDGAATPAPHRQLLDLLARPTSGMGGAVGKTSPGALRLTQLGLELGVDTPTISLAMHELVNSAELGVLLELRELARGGGLDTAKLDGLLADGDFLREHLADDSQDIGAIESILDRVGEAALEPLLEALEVSESAPRRKAILARLERFSSILGPLLVARLPGKPWFVQRNLLGLLGTLAELPTGFSPLEYCRSENAKVRREALKLSLASPKYRDAAILETADDSDSGVALLALAAARESCPPGLIPKLLILLNTSLHDAELRSAAIRLLGAHPSVPARDWLLRQTVTTSGWLWFKRQIIRPRSPDLLDALVVLRTHYSKHAPVQAVLRLALKSADRDIAQAAEGVKST